MIIGKLLTIILNMQNQRNVEKSDRLAGVLSTHVASAADFLKLHSPKYKANVQGLHSLAHIFH